MNFFSRFCAKLAVFLRPELNAFEPIPESGIDRERLPKLSGELGKMYCPVVQGTPLPPVGEGWANFFKVALAILGIFGPLCLLFVPILWYCDVLVERARKSVPAAPKPLAWGELVQMIREVNHGA